MIICKEIIDICILTYKRENLLRSLLISINDMILIDVNAKIIVIDNDKMGSGKKIIEEFKKISKYEVVYDIEPEKGISNARNKALSLVTSKYVAFLDDDEFVSKKWLDILWKALIIYKADVAFGPVIPICPEELPNWLKNHPYFSRTRMPSGTRVETGGCGNVIFKFESIRYPYYKFNNKYSLSGGEDTDFFYRVNMDGFIEIWCDEAIVYENILKDRICLKWILGRSFRTGQTAIRIQINNKKTLYKLITLLSLLFKFFLGIAMIPFAFFVSRSCGVIMVSHVCSVFGKISVFIKAIPLYKEYKEKM